MVIVRAGKPLARLTRLEPTRKEPIRFGVQTGKIWIGDDFDDALPEDFLVTPAA
ncbi:MAG TPA: hypothetical protein VMA34_11800 [Terracidiphilus sp.]|nr:hypothetical protein [Terracidiphilus sp.]